MAKRNQFRKVYCPYDHPALQATKQELETCQQECAQQERGLHLDWSNPNSLVTLAMLGRWFLEAPKEE